MKKYISLLRGINVSGQKLIKMIELKALYESMTFENVNTYIQSGNIVFQSKIDNISELTELIEGEVESRFGFYVKTFIRTPGDVQQVIDKNPFLLEPATDPSGLYVCFLENHPALDKAHMLDSVGANSEKVILAGGEIYLYYPNGFGKSKWTNNFFEKKLCLNATTRNWKTVLKLAEMCG